MKLLLIVAIALAGAACLPGCSHASAPGPSGPEALGPCPSSPNCVCSSDSADASSHIPPLRFDPAGGDPMEALARAVQALGGEVVARDGHYLHATFTSRWLRFVDDLECLAVPGEGVIHVRSASRVGYYDFGVNRRRVEALRKAFEHPGQ